MKKTIMITTTTYRYIEVDVTDEDYFNDLVNDLNIQMQNNSNFDMVFYNMDLEDYNCEVLNDYFEEEILKVLEANKKSKNFLFFYKNWY